MKHWTVMRTWWELTKLVLAGRGRYEFNVYVYGEGISDAVERELRRAVLVPYHLGWEGGDDRYATLAVEDRLAVLEGRP